jgi:hypothetical protein
MVMKIADSAPLRKAHLLLSSVEDPNRTVAAVTNADGHFAMKGIEPGSYRLNVTRVGFVADEYGQRKPDTPGAVLTLHPGQNLKDLPFRLIPAGVISGKIYDDDGEALPGVMVDAVRQVYSEGKRSRSAATSVSTNDLGEYRLYGLSPGHYFVSSVYFILAGAEQNPKTTPTMHRMKATQSCITRELRMLQKPARLRSKRARKLPRLTS